VVEKVYGEFGRWGYLAQDYGLKKRCRWFSERDYFLSVLYLLMSSGIPTPAENRKNSSTRSDSLTKTIK
jgi:hypothetical protein